MMIYEAFLETVKTSIQSRLGEEFTVNTRPVPKNNGLFLDGLCIIRKSKPLSPVIYINPYYIAYQSGMSMEEILYDITALLTIGQLPDSIQLDSLTDVGALTNRIVFHLVNSPANKELLGEIPHIDFPDLELSLIFYLFLEDSKEGRMNALIRNSHRNAWRLTTEDLYKRALENTPKIFPPMIRSIQEVMEDITEKTKGEFKNEEDLSEQQESPSVLLHVLSNPSCIDGACCLMYPDVLKNFATEKGTDIVILPSSIHEVLLAPYHETISYAEMSMTILRINHHDVPLEEQLSNIIYCYSRKEDRITVAFNPCVPIGTGNP